MAYLYTDEFDVREADGNDELNAIQPESLIMSKKLHSTIEREVGDQREVIQLRL